MTIAQVFVIIFLSCALACCNTGGRPAGQHPNFVWGQSGQSSFNKVADGYYDERQDRVRHCAIIQWKGRGQLVGTDEIVILFFIDKNQGTDAFILRTQRSSPPSEKVVRWGRLEKDRIVLTRNAGQTMTLKYDGPVVDGNSDSFLDCEVELRHQPGIVEDILADVTESLQSTTATQRLYTQFGTAMK